MWKTVVYVNYVRRLRQLLMYDFCEWAHTNCIEFELSKDLGGSMTHLRRVGAPNLNLMIIKHLINMSITCT